MSVRLCLCLFMFIGVNGLPAQAAESCDADGDVQFICGPESPEDLHRVPDTPWVIASGRISDSDGFIYAIDIRDYSSRIIYARGQVSSRYPSGVYSDCPGPNPAGFQPHGIALRNEGFGSHTLYVVGHGDREAIEVFMLDVNGPAPYLTWIGCILAPEGTRLNSVTPLPDGAIAATNFNTTGGELWEWHVAAGWTEVPGSDMAGPNGLVASPDGNWFYIGGWSDEALIRLSRGRTPVQMESSPVGFHIDNVRWAPDGSLIVAGQYGAPDANIGACLNGGDCTGIASRAARVDPDSLAVEQLVVYQSNDLLKFGTVGIQVGNEIWLGGIAGSTRIGRFAR